MRECPTVTHIPGSSGSAILLSLAGGAFAGLHDIWGFTSTATDAALSLLVLVAWAIVVTAAAIHVFTRSAVT